MRRRLKCKDVPFRPLAAGLAAELVLRFLWLAERGARDGELRGLSYAGAMLGFFGLEEVNLRHTSPNQPFK